VKRVATTVAEQVVEVAKTAGTAVADAAGTVVEKVERAF
jgi:hypothetical protein